MDNFIDKLAQKWNAGELIKANSAAEAMELKRLQEQAAEYEELLQEMRKLNLKNIELTESSKKLIEEGIGAVSSIIMEQNQNMDTKQLAEEIADRSEDYIHKENVKVYRNVQAVVVDGLKEQTEELSRQHQTTRESLQKLKIMMLVILILTVGNIGLVAAQILGLL